MNHQEARTALITGASGGIGYELAKLFAADGINLVLIARTRDKLETLASELKSIQTHVFVADLSLKSKADELYDFTQQNSIRIDYLVNNAGFGIRNSFADTDVKDILEMLDLNVTALTHLTRLFLPAMLQQKYGRILNVASTAAFQPGPWMSVYYASKAYVLSFSEALSFELKDTGVTVTALCPGPTGTGFQERASGESMRLMKSKMMAVMEAAPVAKAGYDAMMSGKKVIIPGLMNQVLAIGAKVGPTSMSTAIAGNLNKNKK